jgi:hypothetical protein
MLVIRSNAKTPLDENNPENAMYLLSYLNREQYGDWPLLSKVPIIMPRLLTVRMEILSIQRMIASGKYLITDKKEKTDPGLRSPVYHYFSEDVEYK